MINFINGRKNFATRPICQLRKKFMTVIYKNKLWDKNIAQLLVRNTDANSVEASTTFSTKNANDAWYLRCQIREQLIAFIEEQFPEP